MVEVLDYGFEVSKFKLQSSYCIHFLTIALLDTSLALAGLSGIRAGWGIEI